MSKGKQKKGNKALLITALIIVAVTVIIAGINYLSVEHLLEKGSSYSKIEFENQLVPQKDENGNWYFTTDGDFKVMQLTDIHIGGGFMSAGIILSLEKYFLVTRFINEGDFIRWLHKCWLWLESSIIIKDF